MVAWKASTVSGLHIAITHRKWPTEGENHPKARLFFTVEFVTRENKVGDVYEVRLIKYLPESF